MRGAGPVRWAGSPRWDDFYPTCRTPFREKVKIYSHDERPRFCCKQSRFYYERWRFSGGGVRFSWWTVEIFMINDLDFHVERFKFSWWQVDIFIMTDPGLFIALAKISEHEGSISPTSFYGKLIDYWSHVLDLFRCVLLFVVVDVTEQNEDADWIYGCIYFVSGISQKNVSSVCRWLNQRWLLFVL